MLAAWTAVAAPIKIKALKNNVNLRAKPVADAEVVGQVSANDILNSKSMDNEWVEVVPPTNVDLWVFGDFVKGGIIQSRQRVNVRSGPGINFAIVGQLESGASVTLRGAMQDWIKIAPPEACSLWVSRSLVQEVPDLPAQSEPIKVAPAKLEPVKFESVINTPDVAPPVKKPDEQPVETTTRTKPASEAVRTPASVILGANASESATQQSAPIPAVRDNRETADEAPSDLRLVPSAAQGEWKQYDGILRPRGVFARTPSRYRLVSYDQDGDSKTVCYVKGNNDQLSTLINRPMIISGREYWVQKQIYPVLVPDRIVLK